jgi:uncharacterized protein YkwD
MARRRCRCAGEVRARKSYTAFTLQPWFAGHNFRLSRGNLMSGKWAATLMLTLAAGLAGCAETAKQEQPSFYQSLARPGAALDANAAASMISGYRANNGLAALSIDPALMKLAENQARAMADRDRITHNPGGGAFIERLRRSGYDARVAAENISAGYHSLAEAFSGWRDSPPHRANMLLKGADRMGIAAIYVPGSKYKVFWTLIVAAAEDRQG